MFFLLEPPVCDGFLLFIPKKSRSPFNAPGVDVFGCVDMFVGSGVFDFGGGCDDDTGVDVAEDDILVLATILFHRRIK